MSNRRVLDGWVIFVYCKWSAGDSGVGSQWFRRAELNGLFLGAYVTSGTCSGGGWRCQDVAKVGLRNPGVFRTRIAGSPAVLFLFRLRR